MIFLRRAVKRLRNEDFPPQTAPIPGRIAINHYFLDERLRIVNTAQPPGPERSCQRCLHKILSGRGVTSERMTKPQQPRERTRDELGKLIFASHRYQALPYDAY